MLLGPSDTSRTKRTSTATSKTTRKEIKKFRATEPSPWRGVPASHTFLFDGDAGKDPGRLAPGGRGQPLATAHVAAATCKSFARRLRKDYAAIRRFVSQSQPAVCIRRNAILRLEYRNNVGGHEAGPSLFRSSGAGGSHFARPDSRSRRAYTEQ